MSHGSSDDIPTRFYHRGTDKTDRQTHIQPERQKDRQTAGKQTVRQKWIQSLIDRKDKMYYLFHGNQTSVSNSLEEFHQHMVLVYAQNIFAIFR